MQRRRQVLKRRKVRQLLNVLGSSLMLALVGLLFVRLAIPWILSIDWPDWTGFNTYIKPSDTVEREKTLWDWMQLLIVPVVLVIGGFIFNRTEKQLEQVRADERSKIEREIAADNQREEALQAYLDRMSELLIDKGLRNTSEESEERVTARARTLAILRRLDPARKATVLQFLYESQLIKRNNPIVLLDGAEITGANLRRIILINTTLRGISFTGANLAEAYLSESNLSGTDFTGANLIGANLRGANVAGAFLSKANLAETYLAEAKLSLVNLAGADVSEANLDGANLDGANLDGANLRGADLERATVTNEQLATCRRLNGAVLPDGTKVPDDVENPFR